MNSIIKNLREKDGEISRILLKEINVYKNSKALEFFFINNKAVSEGTAEKIKEYLKNYVPESVKEIKTEFIKRVCDAEILKGFIYSHIKENYPAAGVMVKENDISAKQTENGFIYEVKSGGAAFKYFEENGFVNKLNDALENNFCESFDGKLISSDVYLDTSKILSETETEVFEEPLKRRVFEINGIKEIDGEIKDNAVLYMADCDFPSENLTVCGKITKISEKTTKTDKPYFLFELSDGTFDDGMSVFKAKIFPKKKSLDKIRELKEGDSVVINGRNELFNGSLSMFIENIAYGNQPEGFVPEKKISREPPKEYITVKPEPYFEIKQPTLFDKKTVLPDDLVNNTFVVFDLETTGLVNSPIGGERMDTVTEIGAVKIEGGIISEKFTTLVKPDRLISAEITSLTGIDNEMVKDAPALDKVLPDFFKFTRGALLVGHNVEFDYKFIRHYSREQGYIYCNKAFDTVALSQELLYLSNNKLNTVAEHFGFEFNHHRAFDDALTTAKIFIEFIKMKKCLPK